eukprot:TRINITY_DN14762_c0_g1_i1.p1 TRINITY_DN14762_c0_g1~~TRINITY_DN14762_c0_g1_i1.p1  ORF type:complete len:338 (-),score=92.26 TRINITY_DN14762_c0_g1_i1:248-1261(-)
MHDNINPWREKKAGSFKVGWEIHKKTLAITSTISSIELAHSWSSSFCCAMVKARASSKDAYAQGGSSVPLDDSPSQANESLYEVLGVEQSATHQEIRKAYHRLALQLHPDKNREDKDANEKFQKLQKVFSILGDPERRKLYDETGCVDDEELAGDAVKNLCEFLRALYKKVTEDDILEFEAKYRGSEEERKDLLEIYTKLKGKMDRVFEQVLCCDAKLDAHRFKDIIDDAISAGEAKEWKAYVTWRSKIEKTRRPGDPLKSRSKKRKGTEMDISAIIAQRQTDRKKNINSLFSSLTAKYGNEKNEMNEPTEAEFEAARQRIEAKSQGEKPKSKKKSK